VQNVKLLVQYDGTDFHGWQIQAGARTVQGVLTEALSRLDRRPVTVHGAGRTDRGVHAEGQVATVLLTREMSEEEWRRALNANLPPDVRVMAVEFVPPDFHARYSAVSKTYRYTLGIGPVLSPFLYRYAHHFPFPLDVAAMQRALEVIIGEHDLLLSEHANVRGRRLCDESMPRTCGRRTTGSIWRSQPTDSSATWCARSWAHSAKSGGDGGASMTWSAFCARAIGVWLARPFRLRA